MQNVSSIVVEPCLLQIGPKLKLSTDDDLNHEASHTIPAVAIAPIPTLAEADAARILARDPALCVMLEMASPREVKLPAAPVRLLAPDPKTSCSTRDSTTRRACQASHGSSQAACQAAWSVSKTADLTFYTAEDASGCIGQAANLTLETAGDSGWRFDQ